MQWGMSTSDPLATIRMQRLQEYCRSRNWRRDNGDWATNEIAQHLKKPANKISDLLNGRGSFGSKIARDLEIASDGGMPFGFLDGLAGGDGVQQAPRQPRRMNFFDKARFAKLMLAVTPEEREEVAKAIAELTRFPDSGIARARFEELEARYFPPFEELEPEPPEAIYGPAASTAPTWRQAAVTLAAKLSDEGKVVPLQDAIQMIDALHAAMVREHSGARSTTKAGTA